MQLWTALKREIDITLPSARSHAEDQLKTKTKQKHDETVAEFGLRFRGAVREFKNRGGEMTNYKYAELFAANVHERHQRIALELKTADAALHYPCKGAAVAVTAAARVAEEAAYQHHKVGRVERRYGIIHQHALVMMETAQIYDRVWPAAYSFAVFHTNSAKQYPSAIVHGVTTDSQGMYPSPNSMFLKRETDLNFTRIPFCVSYVYYEQHSKFQQRSNRGVLVGYSKDVPGSYVIWQPDENKTKLSAHVTCMEKLKEDGTLLHPAHIFYPELARTKVSKSACVFNIGTKIGPGGRRIAQTSVPHAPSTNLMEIGGELDTHSQKTTHSALDYAFATDVSETPDSNLARTRKPYTRKTMNDGYLPLTNEIWILVYVDDIIFASKNEQTKDIFAGHLRKKYRITEPAQLTWALGMKVSFAADGIILTQDLYVSKILERFGFTSAAKSATTPLAHGTTLTRADEEDAEARHLAQQFVGAILYAAVIGRPDLSSTVRAMSHVMSKPPSNFEACKKHVLRYLSGTINRGIKYNTNSNVPLKLIGYRDASWGDNHENRRSTSGYIFFLNGGPISWASYLQTTVALSTVESEVMALTEAIKEAIYIRRLLESLGAAQEGPTIIYTDSTGAEALVDHPTSHRRTKHIEIRREFIKFHIGHETVKIERVSTKDQLADIMTKPLRQDIHNYLVRMILHG
ncbi:retrovirus-related Pol polyprotein [Pseudoscourfieldia marina]